jgi:IS5 family transposase
VRAKNHRKSRIRSGVERVFGVVKRLWGFGKVRYRGLQKNATRAFNAWALQNGTNFNAPSQDFVAE